MYKYTGILIYFYTNILICLYLIRFIYEYRRVHK